MGSITHVTEEGARHLVPFGPRWDVLALVLLCLAVYLPGVVRLPAVDRTEVIYAETTREMVAEGNWLAPHYGGTVHQFRPIGTFWLQGLAASLAGEGNARSISIYRLPGMVAVTFAVVALYLLSAPLIGPTGGLVAAGLLAVAPLTVLLAQLGIAESLTLLPATVAMLALARIYTAEDGADTRGLVGLFWGAVGFGMLINALLVPIIVVATLVALRFMDKDFRWLGRLNAGWGIALAAAIAAPWLIVRFHQDGVPYAGLRFIEVIEALGGAQDMKLRALPGTFVLAMVLGFLPGTALLVPALLKLWSERQSRLPRFLLAWIVGYLVYLELLSSKPGTYMVQTMFPALAIAVALVVAAYDGSKPPPKYYAFAWPILAAAFAVVLLALPYAFLREWPSVWLWLPMAGVVALFYASAREGRSGALFGWARTGIAALALFAVTLLGGVFPSLEKIWPAARLEEAFATCKPGPRAIFGFDEPSAWFMLGGDRALSTAEGLKAIAAGEVPGYAVMEQGWYDSHSHILSREEKTRIQPLACYNAINVMRGCRVSLTIAGREPTVGCVPPPEYACTVDFMMESLAKDVLPPCD